MAHAADARRTQRGGGPSFLTAAGWIAFALILSARPEAPGDIWRWLSELPLLAEIAPSMLLLPTVVGLAVWERGPGGLERILFAPIALAGIAVCFQPMRWTSEQSPG